jgi:hypothetical protein
MIFSFFKLFFFLKCREESAKFESQILELKMEELKINQFYEKRLENNQKLQDIYNEDKEILDKKLMGNKDLLDSIDSLKSDMGSIQNNILKKKMELNKLKIAKGELENRVSIVKAKKNL